MMLCIPSWCCVYRSDLVWTGPTAFVSGRPRASWDDTAGRKELVDVAAEFVDVKRKAEERCSRLEVLLCKILFVYRVLIRRGVCWFYYYLSLIVLTCRCILSRSWVFEMITLAYKINIPLTFVWENGGVLSFHRLRINHPELIYEEALHPTYVALFAPSPKAEKSPYPMSFFFSYSFFLKWLAKWDTVHQTSQQTEQTNTTGRSKSENKWF